MKFKRRSIEVEAVQWFKMGDHPQVVPIDPKYKDFNPVREGAKGLLITEVKEDSRFIFPGDWIVTEDSGKTRVYQPKDFEAIYFSEDLK